VSKGVGGGKWGGREYEGGMGMWWGVRGGSRSVVEGEGERGPGKGGRGKMLRPYIGDGDSSCVASSSTKIGATF